MDRERSRHAVSHTCSALWSQEHRFRVPAMDLISLLVTSTCETVFVSLTGLLYLPGALLLENWDGLSSVNRNEYNILYSIPYRTIHIGAVSFCLTIIHLVRFETSQHARQRLTLFLLNYHPSFSTVLLRSIFRSVHQNLHHGQLRSTMKSIYSSSVIPVVIKYYSSITRGQ
jgi:hypothetical protein